MNDDTIETIRFTCNEHGELGANLSVTFDSSGKLEPIVAQFERFLQIMGFDVHIAVRDEVEQ